MTYNKAMQSSGMTVSIPQYCYYIVITLMLTSLAVAQQNSIDNSGNEDDLIKRASTHNHNIMRFGRAGHNIMHFGKRTQELVTDDGLGDGNDSSTELDTSNANSEQQDINAYDSRPINIGQRSVRTRYFIPHAFIASLYTHPRPFLKKAAESRDNVFMHFG